MATDYSNPSPTLNFPAEETKTNQESQKQEAAKEKETQKDEIYKTKKINFRGRKKRIILQHKNGPCPLIAICTFFLLFSPFLVSDFTLARVSELPLDDRLGNEIEMLVLRSSIF
ncbi:hypothetical protein V5N11_006190 [Cardamine amara subsp. amara]|uniref:MINDY deubiquitinase domain-containing protein n=1 Tax=Cardamine amara subsp. amara TaxID=228776 RepID=A0ABD1AS19_CARAN